MSLNAWSQTDNTATLLQNYTWNMDDSRYIPAGYKLTLNLNGYTLTIRGNAEKAFTSRSELVINGTTDGSKVISYGPLLRAMRRGKITINGGSYESTSYNPIVYSKATEDNEVAGSNPSTVVINGATMFSEYSSAVWSSANAKLDITNSTISSKSSTAHGWHRYAVVAEGITNVTNSNITGVQGGLAISGENAVAEIYSGTFQTVACEYGGASHYGLYVAMGAIANVHGGYYKAYVPTYPAVLSGNEDIGQVMGIVNIYGGQYATKVQRAANSTFPVSVPANSTWYASFGDYAPLPAGYEYYDTGDATYPYGVRAIPGTDVKEIEEPADPTATIPWQRNTTWSDSNVPEKTTIVTIPKDRTVIVSSAEADKVAEAEQVFVNQGATLIVEGGTTMHIGDGGINVANGGKIIVKEGAVATVGTSGVVTTDPEAISIETTEDNSAVFMIDPAVTENTRPKASVSVKTTAKQIRTAPYEYIWENIVSPTMEGVKPENDWSTAVQGLFAGESSFVSAVYTWNSAANTWTMLSKWIEMVPFKGYQLTNNSANGGVTYTFKGNLVGNGNGNGIYDFVTTGYDYFGNSYTAPIVIAAFLNALDASVYERTVWLYDPGADTYIDINPLTALLGAKRYQKTPTEPITEIRSLQAFILNKVGSGSAATVNYNDAIWSNPRIQGGGGGAPARKDISGINFMNLSVAAGSQTDNVMLVEGSQFTSAFDNGSDATKYMNKSGMNFYANTADAKLSTLVSDNLAGTILSFSAGDETPYTLTFTEVTAENYILRDLVSGKTVPVVEGNTYTFSQTAGTTVDARFVLEVKANAPTAVDAVNSDMTMWVSDNTLFVKGNVAAAPVSVIASNGMEVMRADAVNAAMQTVDLSGLAAGAYIIRVGDALLKTVK